MTSETKEKIRHFVTVNDIQYNDVLSFLTDESVQEQSRMCKIRACKNTDLVGRYFKTPHKKSLFPVMYRYYKILSYRSENEYRVECLIFDEHPVYWFNSRLHKLPQPGNGFLGRFDFDSFITDSIMAKDIRNMQEITEEEFNGAARKYLEELLELKWTPNHNRFGNRLPSDDGWEQTDN